MNLKKNNRGKPVEGPRQEWGGKCGEKTGETCAEAPPAWHALSGVRVLERLGASPDGLSAPEAQLRFRESGPNLLCPQPRWTGLRLAFRQFWSPLSGMLLLAGVLAACLGDPSGAVGIFSIVLLNASFGFLLEYRANSAMRSLSALHPLQALVLRGGKRLLVLAINLVPGDVILLKRGDAVPADVRLLESWGFQCAEAVLSGEPSPVEKEAKADVTAEAPLAERVTMAYAGTLVSAGRARGVVVAVGLRTEMGKIAHLLEATPEEASPGLREIGRLCRTMLYAAGVLVVLLLGVGEIRGHLDLVGSLWMGVSLAVAALPEGLQTVLMAALAFGAHRLVLQKAVVRRLGALETLGCVDLVCTDKTGTLTEGSMSVATVRTAECELALGLGQEQETVCSASSNASCNPSTMPSSLPADSGAKASPLAGGETQGTDSVLAAIRRRVAEALAGACTEAPWTGEFAGWSGDPTEKALLGAARALLPEHARGQPFALGCIQREIPLDTSRRRRTLLRRSEEGGARVYMSGAPEEVLSRCSSEWTSGGGRLLDAGRRRWWSEENVRLAKRSLRVVATAYRPFEGSGGVEEQELECGLILVGLVGLRDAVRPDARAALQRAKALGVRVVMLTGDQPQTAAAIASELGFAGTEQVVRGSDLEQWDKAQLTARVGDIHVYARVSPGDKLRIVEAWRERGAVVAMLGDGVNDAPALRAADVGVAMGGSGTHVTKEAGDLVLLDDRLGTLMEAVAQGRRVRRSVGRSLEYLLTGNMGEVLLIGGGMVGWGIAALTPMQLLWINLATDGFPALFLALPTMGGLGVEAGGEPPAVELTNRRFWKQVLVFGGCAAVCAGVAYSRGNVLGGSAMGRAYAFGTVVFEELCRSVVMALQARGKGGGGGWGWWGVVATAVGGGLLQGTLLHSEWSVRFFGCTFLGLKQIGEAFVFGVAAVCFGQGVLAWKGKRTPTSDFGG